MTHSVRWDDLRPKTNKTYPLNSLTVAILIASYGISADVKAESSSNSNINAIVVTAPAQSSPTTTSIDLNETPALQSATDGADVLTQIPGFSSINNGGANGDPTFRGLFGSRLAVLTDGAQMLGACPNRMDNPSSYITPSSFDAVDIIKGPQTVQWGPGNSAATVRFERKREDFSDKNMRLEASAMVGTYGRFDRRIEGALGSQQGYIRVEANESEANDYQDGNGDTVASAWDKWNTGVALGWTPDQDTWLEVEYTRGDGEAKYAGRNMDGSKFLRETVAIQFEKQNLSEHLSKIEGQFNYAYADHVMDNYTLRNTSMMDMRMELDRRTQSARLASTWDWDNRRFVIGADGKQEVHRQGITTTSSGTEDYSYQQIGLFGEWTEYLEQQRVITGLRFDHVEATDELTTTATAGDTRYEWLVGGFTRLERDMESSPATAYIGLGYSERFPDYWEIKPTNASTSGAVNAFAGVDTEKTLQLDLGYNYDNNTINWWVSSYVGQINDYIIFDYSDTSNPSVGNINALIAGVESGLRYQFTPSLSSNVSLAYAWGEERGDGAPLPQISPLESKLGLTYENQSWTSNAILRMVSAQRRISENMGNVVGYDFDTSRGFATVDLNSRYTFNPHFTLTIGIDNLFDKTYADHLNKAGSSAFGYAANESFNQAGRMLWASVDAKF